MADQVFRLPVLARLGNLGVSYTTHDGNMVIHDWDTLSSSVQTLVNDAMRISLLEDQTRLGTKGPFLPITLVRKYGTLAANLVEPQATFKLAAGKILEIWHIAGLGAGTDTKLRFQNLTDNTTVHAEDLRLSPGTFAGDGVNPLAKIEYAADKAVAFEAVNNNLLNILSLGGYGVFTIS